MNGSARGTFRSLRTFNYRLWAGGAFVSNVGTWMQRTAQDWLVLTQLTHHNATAVGVVMGLQFGYLMGGSILVETVFSWPGTGFLLNSAIFQRDIPVLQGTILVLALFFVAVNLVVDVVQTMLDPRIKRA